MSKVLSQFAQCAVEPIRPQSHCLLSRTAQCYESHIVILSPPTLKTVFMVHFRAEIL